ncbi:glycosyltransferase [uncultured Jatrophihabitans sp.]|uniref:glycosyltransferase n=1 Tax=uncultured Jatrophihabitans sp. TaxID=1610747 RepID=UPI0035CAEB2D
MSDVVHLLVGPAEHGVVRHGREIADACGHRSVHVPYPEALPALLACDVVHVPFTDRLFGPDVDAAGAALEWVAQLVARCGAALSVTLHDVPHDGSPLQLRRRELYRQVMSLARGVVVNSGVELGLMQDDAGSVHSLRRIRLPVERATPARAGSSPLPARSVAVLGFVYPDRGYDDVLAALPPHAVLTALGRASDGHADLAQHYADRAGPRWQLTGYVPDDELGAYLADVAVPVAPNRRVTASASINTWLAHGRRPLVPQGPYGREIARERPGAVELYDPDDPRDLAEAVERALADPQRTRLAADARIGPGLQAVAADYLQHFDSCVPPRAVGVDDGWVVPGNRWDLLAAVPCAARGTPSVSVVIPYFEAQHDLDLVLSALTQQTHPAAAIEVVVVDDGSATPPDVGAAGALPVQVLAQPDEGFRAARARNLGAAAAHGDVLVFLDCDTVPEPGFLAEIARLPAVCPDVVAAGRRRHVDLAGLPPEGLADWFAGRVALPELDEPSWLRDAYRDSADLLDADRRSYRFVISAVLATSARLFAEVGGFDERFVGYGGEDWEFAHRARNAGAVFAHIPAAVAWHDGPDWAQRHTAAQRAQDKLRETAALADLLPDPDERGWTGPRRYPSVVLRAARMSAGQACDVLDSLAGTDCAVWFAAVDGPPPARAELGEPPADVLARAWCHGELRAPADLGALPELAELAERHGRLDTPALTLRAARSLARSARWARDDDAEKLADRWFGRHDRTFPVQSEPALPTQDPPVSLS